MIVLILSFILIALALLEKNLYLKKDKDRKKVRISIDAMIIVILFTISYFITDTTIGLFYVFLNISSFPFMGTFNNRINIEWINCLLNIIVSPIAVYLLFKAIQSMLINPSFIYLLLSLVNLILNSSYKRKHTKRENISFAIGIVISLAIIFSYYKLSDSGEGIMLQQERVAQKYLEEELNMHGLYIYKDAFIGSLRGKETILKGYDSKGNLIILRYMNNKIISHDIKIISNT